jgi:tetratricopeptide (TPR) repeat protein
MGRWEDALQAVDRAQVVIPNEESFAVYGCWLQRAQALIGLKRFDEGFACCDTAMTLWPDGCAAYEIKGLAMHDLQRFDEALDCFDRFVEKCRYDQIKAWGVELQSCEPSQDGPPSRGAGSL